MEYNSNPGEPVTTALLLAAGIGSRLCSLTKNAPKSLTLVHGKSILERLIDSLSQQGFKRLVVVTGHMEHCIRDFLGNQVGDIAIDYIFSSQYKTTNNIYSLWMAREIINEPFLLLESDLVFDPSLLDKMLYPDRIAVAKMQPWMNGSYVTINRSKQVKTLMAGNADPFAETRYKTVNIYSLSLTSWYHIVKRLDQHIADGSLTFKIVSFDRKPWYEIDTPEDLVEAEKLFPADPYTTTKTVTLAQPDIIIPHLNNASTFAPSLPETTGLLHATKQL